VKEAVEFGPSRLRGGEIQSPKGRLSRGREKEKSEKRRETDRLSRPPLMGGKGSHFWASQRGVQGHLH